MLGRWVGVRIAGVVWEGKREKGKGGRDRVEARQGITHTLAHAHGHGI